jgi:hypothetical protein
MESQGIPSHLGNPSHFQEDTTNTNEYTPNKGCRPNENEKEKEKVNATTPSTIRSSKRQQESAQKRALALADNSASDEHNGQQRPKGRVILTSVPNASSAPKQSKASSPATVQTQAFPRTLTSYPYRSDNDDNGDECDRDSDDNNEGNVDDGDEDADNNGDGPSPATRGKMWTQEQTDTLLNSIRRQAPGGRLEWERVVKEMRLTHRINKSVEQLKRKLATLASTKLSTGYGPEVEVWKLNNTQLAIRNKNKSIEKAKELQHMMLNQRHSDSSSTLPPSRIPAVKSECRIQASGFVDQHGNAIPFDEKKKKGKENNNNKNSNNSNDMDCNNDEEDNHIPMLHPLPQYPPHLSNRGNPNHNHNPNHIHNYVDPNSSSPKPQSGMKRSATVAHGKQPKSSENTLVHLRVDENAPQPMDDAILDQPESEVVAGPIARQKVIFERNIAKKNKVENMITKLAEAATVVSAQAGSSPATERLSSSVESVANAYLSRTLEEFQMRMAERKQQEEERAAKANQANMDNMMKMFLQQMQMKMMQQMMRGMGNEERGQEQPRAPENTRHNQYRNGAPMMELNVFSPPRPTIPVMRQDNDPSTQSSESTLAQTMSMLFHPTGQQ